VRNDVSLRGFALDRLAAERAVYRRAVPGWWLRVRPWKAA
jgi:hypothetical protein